MSAFKDLTGQKFTNLTAIERDFSKTSRVHWLCKCDCGNIRSVISKDLISGHSKSCGCLKIEALVKRSTTHNMGHSSEYKIFYDMLKRCHNPNSSHYHNYGGRGVSVCEEWRESFELFYTHIGPRPSTAHSVDRIDNNLGYQPGNVRWSTDIEQANNKRNTTRLSYNNMTMTLREWSEYTGIKLRSLRCRVDRGWSAERILTTPIPISSNL